MEQLLGAADGPWVHIPSSALYFSGCAAAAGCVPLEYCLRFASLRASQTSLCLVHQQAGEFSSLRRWLPVWCIARVSLVYTASGGPLSELKLPDCPRVSRSSSLLLLPCL